MSCKFIYAVSCVIASSLDGRESDVIVVENLQKTVFWARNFRIEGFVSFKFIYAVSCVIASSYDSTGSDVSVEADGSFIHC